jgi:hypothetical protein
MFDLSAAICVVAFAVAIPVLAALVALNQQEVFRHRAANSTFVNITIRPRSCAPSWELLRPSGTSCGSLILASGIVGLAVYSVGYTRLLGSRA